MVKAPAGFNVVKKYKQSFSIDPISGNTRISLTEKEDPTEDIQAKIDAKKALIPLDVEQAIQKDAGIRQKKLDELMRTIDFFESALKEIKGRASGPIERSYKAPLKTLEIFSQSDPDATAYMANLKGMRALIARGLGDVGNLSEVEQMNAMLNIGLPTDTKEVAAKKFDNFRRLARMRAAQANKEYEDKLLQATSGIVSKQQPISTKKEVLNDEVEVEW